MAVTFVEQAWRWVQAHHAPSVALAFVVVLGLSAWAIRTTAYRSR